MTTTLPSGAIEIRTIPELRAALKIAKAVYVQPRFGTVETWLKVSKSEARTLLLGLTKWETPETMEMPAEIFGTLQGATLFIG